MKKVILLLVFLLLVFQNIEAQKVSKIDYGKLSKLEGMEYVGGITFYIDRKSEILIAIQNDTIKWEADVIKKCGKRKAAINSVFTTSGKLKVSFGKSTALVDIENGEIKCSVEVNSESEKTEINFKNNSIIKK
ncbi:hypothetical protein [Flavobacterium chungangense]|uniref:Uncharacterized protein n=1 Tax=Flavobacterium chungangense TaxID=554283 RepID=A0A6V6YR16_9FLAO|nr:hypothetical protein [Flavobacterium chungangense]CAD0001846.1 hypothetical protein FLACHUCJ7_00697 [Flavobacterium chungangense]